MDWRRGGAFFPIHPLFINLTSVVLSLRMYENITSPPYRWNFQQFRHLLFIGEFFALH